MIVVLLQDPAALDVQGAGQEKAAGQSECERHSEMREGWLSDCCAHSDNWSLRQWWKDRAKSRGTRDQRWEQERPAFSCSPYYSVYDFSPGVTASLQRSPCLSDSWIKIQLLLIPSTHGCSDWHQHVLERYHTRHCPPEWSKQDKASPGAETLNWDPLTVFLGSVEGGCPLEESGCRTVTWLMYCYSPYCVFR